MNNKEMVIVGAGKIGRGYLAEIFRDAGYHITFLVHSEEQTKALNKQGYYTIFRVDAEGKPVKVVIKDYSAYCVTTEHERCVEALCGTKYALLPIYPGACEFIGHMIGDAILKRMELDIKDTLDVYLCVNFLQATKTLKGFILEKLTTEAQKAYFEQYVGIVETLVSRLAVDPQPYMAEEDPLSVSAGFGPKLPVDKDAIKGEPPAGEDVVPLMDRLPVRFTFKIWSTNMMHFAVSLYGAYKGYTYVREAASDPYVVKCVMLAEREARHGLAYEYGLSLEEVNTIFVRKDNVMGTWANPGSNDTFDRVVRDMRRKLSAPDRTVGPALACLKSGKIPYFLARVIALALLYKNESDPTTLELHDLMEKRGINAALTEFSSLTDDDPDKALLKELVIAAYQELDPAPVA